MRVLSVGSMYPPHHLGGAELTWYGVVGRQREAGHQVRILTTDFRVDRPDPAVPDDPTVHRELRWYWHEHRFPRLGPLERLRIERHNARTLDRHLVEFSPDVLVWWAMGGMSLALFERVRLRGLPAVGIVQDDFFAYAADVDGWQRLCRRLGPAGPVLGRLTGIPAPVDLNRAATWIFNSETMRRRAGERGIAASSSKVAYPGIDPAAFPPRPARPWGGRLLYLGRVEPRKGVATAIESLVALPEATLRVVGAADPGYLEELHGLVARAGLGGRVSFGEGPRERVPGLLADADAVVFPVLWEEPWGLVPLEAMASGTPVVATGRGGSGEYLRNRENCLIFRPADDPGDLARALRELESDPELRARVREGGLRTARRFTAAAFNDAIIRAIEEAVE